MSIKKGPFPNLGAGLLAGLALAVSGLLIGCAPSEPPVAEPPPATDTVADRAAVVEAHEELLAAMEAGDGAAVTALLDDRHDVLVFHPAKETRFDGPEEIAQGISSMMGRLAPVDVTEVHLQVWTEGDVAWLTSHMLLESDAVAEPMSSRGTEVWVRADGAWRLAHAHWSAHPGN